MKHYQFRCAGSYSDSINSAEIKIGPEAWAVASPKAEMEAEAEQLCKALRGSLPCGVLDRLVEKLVALKAEDDVKWAKAAGK